MPFIQRFTDVKKGGITFTGNTLGLSKAADRLAPGTEGSIGAFTSLDEDLQVGSFPMGTTSDYTENGSEADLTLPSGSAVLYAELIWGGLFRSSANDISALTDGSITFTTPQGLSAVAPDPATAQSFTIPASGITLGFYVRTADVTALVRAAGGGAYAVQGVPALIEASDNRTADTNHAGWTLAVVYENQSLPLRSLTVWSGGTAVSPEEGSATVTVADFLTPDTLPVTGKIFVSAQEGDAALTGDRMLFGHDRSSLSPLSGVNNPQNNFFASQINGDDGALVTSGTFGSRNADAAAGANTPACRQGWDITAVDVSDKLAAGQSEALIRFTSDGDLYVPNALGLQIDSKGADIRITKTADRAFAETGEEITYTVTLENGGDTDALNVTLSDGLPDGVIPVDGSVTVDGAPYEGGLPIVIPTISAGQTAAVSFKAVADRLPSANPAVNVAEASYKFYPFAGYPAEGSAQSDPAEVLIIKKQVAVAKSADKAFAAAGDTLTYTSEIANTGSVALSDIIFRDEIPAGTTFKEGSVYIDGVNYPDYDPQTGFAAGALTPQASVKITFQVQIN